MRNRHRLADLHDLHILH